MELIPITLQLMGKPYKVKIFPQAEEALRASVKTMNDNIEQFRKTYAGLQDIEYLTMAVLTHITSSSDSTTQFPEQMLGDLKAIDLLLD